VGEPNIEKMKAKRDVEGLTKALGYQKDSNVRIAAAKALGQICDIKKNIRQSAEAITEPEWNWYKNGPPPCVEPLMAMCSDENLEVSTTAIWALGRIGDRKALGLLVSIQMDKSESAERRRAAEKAVSSGASSTFTEFLSISQTQGTPWLDRS